MKRIMAFILLAVACLLFLCGMTQMKNNLPVVSNFDINKYLGTWYEIARFPHSFERGLDRVTATYSLREDGKIDVLNKGYLREKFRWKEAKGKAWIPDYNMPAKLKVSFFWPFAAEYNIVYIDENYETAIVVSSGYNYFWLLSRTSMIEDEMYSELIKMAAEWGFDVSRIERVNH